MVKCLEKHKHLIFLKQEQWLLSKILIKFRSEKLGCYTYSNKFLYQINKFKLTFKFYKLNKLNSTFLNKINYVSKFSKSNKIIQTNFYYK
jgi:hypothetical protein